MGGLDCHWSLRGHKAIFAGVAVVAFAMSAFIVALLVHIHRRMTLPLGKRYLSAMLMISVGYVGWSINCVVAFSCAGLLRSEHLVLAPNNHDPDELADFVADDRTLVIWALAFCSAALICFGDVALALVMGVSVLAVASGSELNYAEFSTLKTRKDRKCKMIIGVCGVLALVVGVGCTVIIKLEPTVQSNFRYTVFYSFFVAAPTTALVVYAIYFRRFLSFARSIESAVEDEQNKPLPSSLPLAAPRTAISPGCPSSATVERFQRLYVSRVALYLSTWFLLVEPAFTVNFVASRVESSQRRAELETIAEALVVVVGIVNAIVYLRTENFLSTVFGDSLFLWRSRSRTELHRNERKLWGGRHEAGVAPPDSDTSFAWLRQTTGSSQESLASSVRLSSSGHPRASPVSAMAGSCGSAGEMRASSVLSASGHLRLLDVAEQQLEDIDAKAERSGYSVLSASLLASDDNQVALSSSSTTPLLLAGTNV